MPRLIALLLLTLCAGAAANIIGSVLEEIDGNIQQDVMDMTHNVEKGITDALSRQCPTIKEILGVSVDFWQAMKPKLDDLKLEFRNRTFNLATAAELIPDVIGYDPNQKLYIFIHGFTDDPSAEAFSNIKNALFCQGNMNVLALDASSYIASMYLRSSTYVVFIGEKLGEVLARMVKDGLDPGRIHIIGHSLGAHIAGFTGKQLYKTTGLRVGRISGLDPAGPCYSTLDDTQRLSANDAGFVDVTHTNAGVLGLNNSIGHVDYWPNGGSKQPNCLICSHKRSWQYFAESVVDPTAFPAVKCESWYHFKKGKCNNKISFMGFASNPAASGNYYLRTGGEPPFGLGVDGTVYVEPRNGIVTDIVDKVFSIPQTLHRTTTNMLFGNKNYREFF